MKPMLWTPEEDAIVCAMVREGKTYAEASEHLPGRSYAAVKCRVRLIGLTPEELKESNRKKRARRIVPVRYQKWESVKKMDVPPELYEDRNNRLMAPRDLTGQFFGDPPKGFSALERRA